MLLSDINPVFRDETIILIESTHKYIVNDSTEYISVTTFIKQQFPEFDASKIAENIVKNGIFDTDNCCAYCGFTKEEILNEWRDCALMGTMLHNDIELFYNKQHQTINNASVEYDQFLKFAADHDFLEPFRTELKIYSETLKIAGSIDMLYRLENGHYLIADWKRSKKISFQSYSGEKCNIAELNHIPNCNYSHYCLQLNMYRYILESEYNYNIDGMFIVVFHPNNASNTYEIHPILRDEDTVLSLVRKRLREMTV
jgi:hypothetical protein